ncbi:MAG TPA: GNAT family N-acetyltransferase [Dongiaceae bacterium]|jgi:GNAT superfamily N-acetyltransferase
MNLVIELVKAPTAEVRGLLEELNQALSGPYSDDQRHALSVEQLFQPDIRFYLAKIEGLAVACGGVAFLDGYGELKRMYSRPAVRGRGVAKALLHRLEAETREAGLTLLRIETGMYQEEALRFYERAGYKPCGPFGPYAQMPPHAIATSRFYEKRL